MGRRVLKGLDVGFGLLELVLTRSRGDDVTRQKSVRDMGHFGQECDTPTIIVAS